MATLIINLSSDSEVCNGKQFTFKAPCDCKDITGIIINEIL